VTAKQTVKTSNVKMPAKRRGHLSLY